MKLIKSSFSILNDTNYNIESIYKRIELVGRCSHKSEDKITEDSAKTFVDRIINWGHNSCLEFGTIYLHINYHDPKFNKIIEKYITNEYSKCIILEKEAFITTNYRIIIENNWLDDLKYLCKPTKYHHKRYTVKFICDRGILAEFTRHRKFSFMAESSRYCNYSKGKFNSELTFIIPCWINDIEEKSYCAFAEYYPNEENASKLWFDSCMNAEDVYIDLLNKGRKPEQARNILPLSLKTELYMCGYVDDWKHFCNLRCANNAHPEARKLALGVSSKFISLGYI